MTASIGAYTFLLFAVANLIFLPFIWFFYPETTGRTLEELDVLFAHAHIVQQRPTIVAEQLPPLTDHQVQTLTERYGIHDEVEADAEAGRSRRSSHSGTSTVDTTLPPAAPGDQ